MMGSGTGTWRGVSHFAWFGALLRLGPCDHLGSSWGWGSWWALVSCRLRCLAGFGAGGVVNSTSDLLFTAPPAHEVGLALEFVGSFGVQIFFFLNFFDVGGFLDGVVVLDHVGCGTACHSISLRHLLSFRISRIIFFQTNS